MFILSLLQNLHSYINHLSYKAETCKVGANRPVPPLKRLIFYFILGNAQMSIKLYRCCIFSLSAILHFYFFNHNDVKRRTPKNSTSLIQDPCIIEKMSIHGEKWSQKCLLLKD